MAENEILLFTDKHLDWGAQKLDDVVDVKSLIKNKVVATAGEALDGKFFRWTLGTINAKVSPHVPDELKADLHAAFDDLIDGDDNYTEAIEAAFNILDEVVDTYIEDDKTQNLLEIIIGFLRVGVLSVTTK